MMNLTICEVCEGKAEKICGYDDQPMLVFCTEDYIDHLETAHTKNKAAQAEAKQLRAQLKESERGLRALIAEREGKRLLWLTHHRRRAMTEQWLNEVCKPGQGASSCSFLSTVGIGWKCAKLVDGLAEAIQQRREAGTMKAMGDNCSGDGDFLIVPPITAAKVSEVDHD